jgi:hypothetical protein
MRIRNHHFAIVVCAVLSSASLASAQGVYNPIAASPYARPNITPYLNLNTSGTAANTFYRGVLEETALRNQSLRLSGILDYVPSYELWRLPAYQSVTGYQSAEDWVNLRVRETQLSPTGHPAGFMLATPYYRMPNQRTFLPSSPPTGQQQQPLR